MKVCSEINSGESFNTTIFSTAVIFLLQLQGTKIGHFEIWNVCFFCFYHTLWIAGWVDCNTGLVLMLHLFSNPVKLLPVNSWFRFTSKGVDFQSNVDSNSRNLNNPTLPQLKSTITRLTLFIHVLFLLYKYTVIWNCKG